MRTELVEVTKYTRDDYDIKVTSLGIDYKYSIERYYSPLAKDLVPHLLEYCYLTLNTKVDGKNYQEIEIEADDIEEATEVAYRILDEIIPKLIDAGKVWEFEFPDYVRDFDDLEEQVESYAETVTAEQGGEVNG